MIFEASSAIAESLDQYMQVRFSTRKGFVALSNVQKEEGAIKVGSANKIAITLINTQKETLVNRTANPSGQPPVFLNLFLLFSVYTGEDGSYEDSLSKLSAIISFFQANRVLTHSNTPSMDSNIDKLIFEFVNQDMQSLNYVWSMLKGEYAPSVLYKVRLVMIDEGHFEQVGRIIFK